MNFNIKIVHINYFIKFKEFQKTKSSELNFQFLFLLLKSLI